MSKTDTKLFEFLAALDEHQVLLMKGQYSFKQLAATRSELISRFKEQSLPSEKKPEAPAAKPITQQKPAAKPTEATTVKPATDPLNKALNEKAEWNKAWHMARTNGGKMYWSGYREGVKAQRKIQHSDNPEADAPYLDLNCRIPSHVG